MTTLHLLPETGRQTASTLKQNSIAMPDEIQSLRHTVQSLKMSWQGGGQGEFAAQANSLLSKLQNQVDTLQFCWTSGARHGNQSLLHKQIVSAPNRWGGSSTAA